jgi:hypothetical protein
MARKKSEIILIVATSVFVLGLNIFLMWVMVKAVIIVVEKVGQSISANIAAQTEKSFFDVWDAEFAAQEEKEYGNCYKLHKQDVPNFESFNSLEKIKEISELTKACLIDYKDYKIKDMRVLEKMKQFTTDYEKSDATLQEDREAILKAMAVKMTDKKYKELEDKKNVASIALDTQIGELYVFLERNFSNYKIDAVEGIVFTDKKIETEYLNIIDKMQEIGNQFQDKSMELDNYWAEKTK